MGKIGHRSEKVSLITGCPLIAVSLDQMLMTGFMVVYVNKYFNFIS